MDNEPRETISQRLRKIGEWILFVLVGAFFVYILYIAFGLTLGWLHFGDGSMLLGGLLSGFSGYELICGLLAFGFMALAFWSTVRGQKK
ncbi:MAG: hypothetical protein WD751_05665 [Anaerolineales bacterium]